MDTKYTTTKKATAKNVVQTLYIGKSFTTEQLQKMCGMLVLDLNHFQKPSNGIPYNGTALFLEILGGCMEGQGIPQEQVAEFINSLQ